MSIASQNISGFAARTLALNIEVTLDGTVREITNDTLRAYLKPSLYTLDADALATLTEGSGITKTDAAAGLANLTFSAAQTTLTAGTYFYHISLETTTGALYSIAHGLLTLQQV